MWRDIVDEIAPVVGVNEGETIAFLLLQKFFSANKPSILANSELEIPPEKKRQVENAIERLKNEEPIQYIIGTASFYGREFRVNDSVLIPRPETEELINVVLKHCSPNSNILDIGAGSGIIAITLSLEKEDASIIGIDKNPEAILIAEENAKLLEANVSFKEMDILNETPDMKFDIIVSNPPYITLSEKSMMKKNVLNFEPHDALFVPDSDPLIFYKRILEIRHDILNPEGKIICEINERLGKSAFQLFDNEGIKTDIIKDISGKDRIVVGQT